MNTRNKRIAKALKVIWEKHKKTHMQQMHFESKLKKGDNSLIKAES